MIHINYLAILIAVVANFIFGFIWYTPLFGKIWGREMHADMSQKPKSSEMIKGMIFMVIGNFLFAWVFAHNMAAWSFVPNTKDMSLSATAMMGAIFTWLGFFFPVFFNHPMWWWNRHSFYRSPPTATGT